MCIINAEAEVKKTKILVGPSSNGQRQFVAYSNQVATSQMNNAMILPVPYPETVKFHDLTNYKQLFTDCENCFPRSASLGQSDGMYFSAESVLKVHEVGSYQVSICMNLGDFNRIDQSVFTLNTNVQELLQKHYGSHAFGFLVCKLRNSAGLEDYHPLGYSHRIYRKRGYLFVPTRHHHGGANAPEEQESDWEHEIYSINTNEFASSGLRASEFVVKLDRIDFDLAPARTFHRMNLSGRLHNCDVILTLTDAHKKHDKFVGIDGCKFETTGSQSSKIVFKPSTLATLPGLAAKNGFFQFSLSADGTPLVFFGNHVIIETTPTSVIIHDEPNSSRATDYEFLFTGSGRTQNGQNFLRGRQISPDFSSFARSPQVKQLCGVIVKVPNLGIDKPF